MSLCSAKARRTWKVSLIQLFGKMRVKFTLQIVLYMMSVDHSIMIKLLIGDSICGIFISQSLGGSVGGLLWLKMVHSCHFFKVYLNYDDNNNSNNKCFFVALYATKEWKNKCCSSVWPTQFLYPLMIVSYSWLQVKVTHNKYCV